MSKVNYALEIVVNGITYRYATFRGAVPRTVGCEEIIAPFKPYVIKFDPENISIDITGQSPVPTAKATIYDPDREMVDSFNEFDYETSYVNVLYLNEELDIIGEFKGYVTDFSWVDGQVSFTIRSDATEIDRDFLKMFEYDTFQSFEILSTKNVGVKERLTLNEDTPWSIYRGEFRRGNLADQRMFLQLSPSGTKTLTNGRDGGHVNPGLSAIKVKLKRTGLARDQYEYYTETTKVRVTIDDLNVVSFLETVKGLTSGSTGVLISEVIDEDDDFAGYADIYVDMNEDNIFSVGEILTDEAETAAYATVVSIETKHLSAVPKVLFGEYDGRVEGAYKYLVIGNAEREQQVIAYGYSSYNSLINPDGSPSVFTNDLNSANDFDQCIYFSMIPSSSNQDPLGLYAGQEALFTTKFGINSHISKGTIVAPIEQNDYLWVKANGMVPYGEYGVPGSEIIDQKIGRGFVWTGRTFDYLNGWPEVYAATRYKIVKTNDNLFHVPDTDVDPGQIYLINVYDDDIDDGTEIEHLLKLRIDNRWATFYDMDTAEEYPIHENAVNNSVVGQGSWEIKSNLNDQDPVKLLDFKCTMSFMDNKLDSVDQETYEYIKLNKSALKDRYRGYRIDMLSSYNDFIYDAYGSNENLAIDGQDPSSTNLNLINNANGSFAVCIGSEIISKDDTGQDLPVLVERIYFETKFYDKEQSGGIYAQLTEQEDTDVTNADTFNTDTESSPEAFYNNFIYTPIVMNASLGADGIDVDIQEAINYFSAQKYRVIKEPVPENSNDLGKYFPIVYGYAEQVPVINAISKKTYASESVTTGDDLYIYASHRTDVVEPSDIKIYLYGDEQDRRGGQKPIDPNDFSAALAADIIQSPFPDVLHNHYELIYTSEDDVNGQIVFKGKLNNPYHKLEVRRSIDGDTLFGFKLRGDEWNKKVGKFDSRYAIRNGVGSSKLYASYSGYVDELGNLVEHPCDIILHFVRNYGMAPYSTENIDEASLKYIKSITPKYRASVFIDQPMTVKEFIDKMCKQFGFVTYFRDGKLKFRIIQQNVIQYEKPISENYNIIHGVKEESKGYGEIYTKIIYQYDYNYVSEQYDQSVFLNQENNALCARASRAKGNKKDFSVEAKWVKDTSVARDVAFRYVNLLSKKRTTYSLDVEYADDVLFEVGDIVPITYERFGFDETPVLIESVKYQRDVMSLTIVFLE